MSVEQTERALEYVLIIRRRLHLPQVGPYVNNRMMIAVEDIFRQSPLRLSMSAFTSFSQTITAVHNNPNNTVRPEHIAEHWLDRMEDLVSRPQQGLSPGAIDILLQAFEEMSTWSHLDIFFQATLDQAMIDSEGLQHVCPVGRDPFQPGDRVIRLHDDRPHWYHVDCIVGWLDSHWTCPYCMQDLPEILS